MSRMELAERKNRQKEAMEQEQKAEDIFPKLPKRRFGIIYADPPWDYKGQLQHNGAGGRDTGGAMRHYPTVTLEQLALLPVKKIADRNSLLFMWSSSPHLDQAIDLGKSWGFQWATVAFVWNKQKVNPGYYTMSQCELCLCFKKSKIKGKIPTPRRSRIIRQLVIFERGKHSTKPAEVRKRIDDMFPKERKVELFARERVLGWKAWGLESHG